MKKIITLCFLMCLVYTSRAQYATLTTFGRFGPGCDTGRGTCSFTEPASLIKANSVLKKISDDEIMLEIDRKNISVNDETAIAGKLFSNVTAGETLLFVQETALVMTRQLLTNLKINAETAKIEPGNYPMYLNKDTVQVIFKLKKT